MIILIVNQVPQFLFAPVWIRLSTRFGKRNLWVFATMLSAVSFGSLFFAEERPGLYVYVCAFFAGIGQGAGAMLALMPAGFYIVGALLLSKFSFNEEEHDKVRKELDARAAKISQGQ